MARQTNTSRTVHAIDLPQELQLNSPMTGRIEGNQSLPVYAGRGSNYFKKDISRSRLRDNLVHLIPVVLLLCLFILWLISHPVNLERKNERIVGDEKEDMLELVNVTLYPLVPYVQIMKNSSRAKRVVGTE